MFPFGAKHKKLTFGVILIIFLIFCAGYIDASQVNISHPTESSNEPSPLFWPLPNGQYLNLSGDASDLFNCIINYYSDSLGLPSEDCIIPAINVFAKVDETGEYYVYIESICLSYLPENSSTLQTSFGGGYFKIDTIPGPTGLTLTSMIKLSLDGNYEYTKEQLDKVPGLFEAYDNKNLVPLSYIWTTPPLSSLTYKYLSKCGFDFEYVDNGDEQVQLYSEWLNDLNC